MVKVKYDSVLDAEREDDLLGVGVFKLQGDWNANTNTPDITGTTETGYSWRVSVAGNTNLGGITDWRVGDIAVFEGAFDINNIALFSQDVQKYYGV